MKKVTIYFIILLSCSRLYAQLPDSLANYYQLVNKAELNIVDSNYSKAFQNYEEAFTYKKAPFGKDIYNEAICAVLLDNYKKTYVNFKHLLAYGYEMDSLRKKEVLVDFFSSELGMKLKKDNEQKVLLYDIGLRKKYDSLFFADQYFRLKEGSYDIYGDTIKKIDIANVAIIQKLIKDHGFPSQYQVGLYSGFSYFSIQLMIIHNCVGSHGGQFFDFTDILYSAVHKGKLDARVALYLFTRSRKGDPYGFAESGIVKVGVDVKKKNATDEENKLSSWGFFKLKKEKENELNRKREKIGLDSIKNDRRKVVYNLKDNRFHLVNPAGRQKFLFKSEIEAQKVLSRLTFLK